MRSALSPAIDATWLAPAQQHFHQLLLALAPLPDSEWQWLQAQLSPAILARGDYLCAAGKQPAALHFLVSGVVRFYYLTEDGKEFNIFSTTLPVIFDNAKNIKSAVEFTEKGAIVTRTSTDAKVVAALQGHADEVTELVKEGPVAFHRGIDARMAMGPGGPRGARANASPTNPAQNQQHAH